MKKQSSKAPGYTIAAIVAAGIVAAGCGAGNTVPDGPEYLGVCVNQVTGLRVDDALCNGLGGPYTEDWVDTWASPNFIMPAYGARFSTTHVTVIHVLPRGVTSSRTVPRLGGSATTIRSGLARTSSGPVGGAGVRPGNSAGTGSKVGSGGVSSGTSSSIQRGGFGIPGSGGAGGRGSISGGGISAGG